MTFVWNVFSIFSYKEITLAVHHAKSQNYSQAVNHASIHVTAANFPSKTARLVRITIFTFGKTTNVYLSATLDTTKFTRKDLVSANYVLFPALTV